MRTPSVPQTECVHCECRPGTRRRWLVLRHEPTEASAPHSVDGGPLGCRTNTRLSSLPRSASCACCLHSDYIFGNVMTTITMQLYYYFLLFFFGGGVILSGVKIPRVKSKDKSKTKSWSGHSSSLEKLLCSKIELKCWIVIDMLWKRKLGSRLSPEIDAILRPSSEKKVIDDSFNGPSVSAASVETGDLSVPKGCIWLSSIQPPVQLLHHLSEP